MKRIVLAAVFLLCSTGLAGATLSLVTNESGITANGLIDWEILGGINTLVSTPFDISIPGVIGLKADVSMTSGTMVRRDQGNGWNGNFGPGEKLLWTGSNTNYGPITLDFNKLVRGVGTQIQADFYGPFKAVIKAFDVEGALLGSFSENGISDSQGDDTALFFGIISDTATIDKVSFTVLYNGNPIDFAINGPRVQTASAPVPIPSTALLLGPALVGLALWRRK